MLGVVGPAFFQIAVKDFQNPSIERFLKSMLRPCRIHATTR